MIDTLGDRMKRYENVSRYKLTPRSCVILRVDGKAFHTFTRKCKKPFDEELIEVMILAAKEVSKQIQGFKLGYIQSDEASFLLTDFDKFETNGWFDYNLAKLTSVTASLMTGYFNFFWNETIPVESMEFSDIAAFDCRAFNIPESDVANYFLWRAKDWERNSLSMYARSFFSAKELHGKGRNDIHDMLHEIGKNWTTDLYPQLKNGTYIRKNGDFDFSILPNYTNVDELVKESMKVEVEND